MKKAEKIKKEEQGRVAALHRLDLLDTPAEKAYDNITELAAYICETPIALINLIDEDRQWMKSKVGVPFDETPRDSTFCRYAISNAYEFLEVKDARKDERFNDNIFVQSEKNPIVFYAAYPLKDPDGFVVGMLSLIDHKPRKLNDRQKQALATLGSQIELLFEIRLKNIQLKSSESDLKRHNDLLKNFAGAVSHDLKMPLASIIMTIDILKTKYGKLMDEQGISYLNRLKQSSFGMSDYITNILEYYETENVSSKDYAEDPFGLRGFLESIVDMLNIEEDCEINLPQEDVDMVCNRSGLEQIFLNLLGNSLKYNDKKKAVITVKAHEKNGYYNFEVTDNGMGIQEDHQEHIFDLFNIANERDRYGKKGNGIGLSTVHKLVHKLGGTIAVDSEVGKYTTFTFSIRKQKSRKQETV